ncbi:ribbon-helix-helix domain-containing protein [Streptosporangium soli]|nr:ribbon-helix-helix domain-containing protein [Streptosporangium sp. KLBMP 9127]
MSITLNPPGYTHSMTKKIGVSVPDDLFRLMQEEVESGRAASISGLISDAVGNHIQRIQLAALVTELVEEFGEPGPEAKAWADEVLAKARRLRLRSMGVEEPGE